MRTACRAILAALVMPAFVTSFAPAAVDGNRLAYLDGNDPYYPHRGFARLTTPQWVGEAGVDAVVILSIDDLRDTTPQPLSIGQYEAYLRPILNRLKQIDGQGGRAAVSIMACRVDPANDLLQTWLKEGVSLETHTLDHPCPLLHGGDFAKAKATYDGCVDLLASVPGNAPVAFRMPCCDSKNTPSPRFFAEIFNRRTPAGRHLAIDSSVFNITTSKDPALPKELTTEPDGTERFRKYVPFPSFVNTIEDYPYPYVIGRLCWEFPCAIPSDWQAQNLHGSNNPKTVEDWKAQLDATVIKQGVMPIVFHPHGWIKPEQMVELIDYAAAKHGTRVKFLTFKEAKERIDKNLLAGHPLRNADGEDNGVRVLDINDDGYMDVVVGNAQAQVTRIWAPKARAWNRFPFPARAAGARFEPRADGVASIIAGTFWRFASAAWGQEALAPPFGESGLRFRDMNGDGHCELIADSGAVYAWSAEGRIKVPLALPRNAGAGARFADLDADGDLDIVFSDERRYGVYRFVDMKTGWEAVRAGERGKGRPEDEIPPISVNGTDNGAWFHSKHLWVQNEHTADLPDHVARVSFERLIGDRSAAMPAPVPPEKAVETFKVHPGFKIELVAHEPLVRDPIAFNWGADGRLWVVEMGDYPLGLDGKGMPGGTVKVLADVDRDGRYDKATTFLDKLRFPTGVTPWRNGVLVTAAPDIFYAEDTDGDGVADRREVLFTGFVEGNQQHRVNGLVYGLDNWFYGANGDSGGQIKSLKTGKVVDISRRDFRINPDTGEIDPVSGQAQFGRTRDDWGTWFGCNNSNPNFQYVLDDRYIRRNPHAAAPGVVRDVPEVPGAAPVYPISKTLERFNRPESVNRFTSACGLAINRDELLGPGYRGHSFVSEPVHNLIHREVVRQDGILMKSRRADDERRTEFVASTDNWFRPTMIRTGPDGAMYVADMYRLVIEHPEWIPQEWQRKLDLRAGHDMGRIYRFYPAAGKPREVPNLAALDAAGLVAALDAPGGWQRDTAQQLLVERQDKSAVSPLEQLAAASQRPLARLHALCTLDGLGALQPAVLVRATTDPQPGVRAHAVRLSERRLQDAPELAEAVLKLAQDPDPTVRLQLAYTLGEWDDPRAAEALGAIALRDANDPHLSAAVMSSVNATNLARVLTALTADAKRPPAPALQSNLLRMAAAFGDEPALAAAIRAVARPVENPGGGAPDAGRQFAALAAALDGLEQAGAPLAKLSGRSPGLKDALAQLGPSFDAAREAAIDDATAADVRAAAAGLLGRGADADERAVDAEILAGLLNPQAPEKVQSAAIAALSRLPEPAAADALLKAWPGMTPALRLQTLDAMLRRRDRVPQLLDAIERRTILAAELDATRRRRLLEHGDEAVRGRAAKAFAGAVNPDRQKVIDEFRSALTLAGDAGRGRAFFKEACAACHKVADLGVNVGPDLLSLADRSPAYYLLHVLDPSRAVEARYTNYVVETKTGQMFAGVLTGETGNSVTVTGPGGVPQSVLRSDLKRLRATPLSAMPEGLEIGRTPQDFADLVAFINEGGKAPAQRQQ